MSRAESTVAHPDVVDIVRYVGEVSPDVLAANPPSRIDLEVLAVDPVVSGGSGAVRVQVRIPT